MTHSRKTIELAGLRIGKWTALCRLPAIGSGKGAQWLCQCDCGYRMALSSQRVRSCGARCPACHIKLLRRKRRYTESELESLGILDRWWAKHFVPRVRHLYDIDDFEIADGRPNAEEMLVAAAVFAEARIGLGGK